MAQQFFVRRGNQEQGPFSPEQIKQLAATGKLVASDLVRTSEKPAWRQAGTVKGLFGAERPATSLPPPPPPHAPQTSPASSTAPPPPPSSSTTHVASAVQSGLTSVLSTAKEAKDLAAAHARKTQINQMTLPKAYLALGKEVFEAGRSRDQFGDIFQRITAINEEIAKVAASDKDRPQATDLKGKLQAGAAHLLAQGQGTKLGLQRDTLLRELGRKAFEAHGPSAGSDAVIAEITQAHAEIGRLDQEIGRLSAASRGKLLTPGRLLIGGGVAAAVMVMMLLVVVAAASKAGRTQAVALKDVLRSNSPKDFVGKQVIVTGRQTSVVEIASGRHRLTLNTEQGIALCELHRDHVKRAYIQSGEMTVVGKFSGIDDGDIELTDCRFADEVAVTVTKPEVPRIRSKDDFIAALKRNRITLTPAIRDDKLEYFIHEHTCHPTLGGRMSYDDWVEAFGEPVQVRKGPPDTPSIHNWAQDYGSFRCSVSGVLFTPAYYEPWQKAGGYENKRSEWKVHVGAISFD
jgi:hypothetical protein